jgi:dihydroceramidase
MRALYVFFGLSFLMFPPIILWFMSGGHSSGSKGEGVGSDPLGPSTVDWCERNYQYSNLVAEFWNTLSSVPIAGMGLAGALLHRRRKPRDGRAQAKDFAFEQRIFWSFVGMFVIGLGSILFHGTLLAFAQAADELPMMYASLIFLYSLLRLDDGAPLSPDAQVPRPGSFSAFFRSANGERALIALFACVGVTDTLAYFILTGQAQVRFSFLLVARVAALIFLTLFRRKKKFVFFLVSYLGVIITMCILAFRIFTRTHDKTHRRLFMLSAVTYVAGSVFLWVPEQLWCGYYQETHGFHLQLHAWFHLTSSVGPYCFVLFVSYERYRRLKMTPTLELIHGVLPVLNVDEEKTS